MVQTSGIYINITIYVIKDKKTFYASLKTIYYIDTDEILGFLLLLKNHIFTARSEHNFIFHM